MVPIGGVETLKAMAVASLPDTLVVGLGKSGVSAVRWLASRGVRVRATDSRESPPGRAAIADLLPPQDQFLGHFAPEALEGKVPFTQYPDGQGWGVTSPDFVYGYKMPDPKLVGWAPVQSVLVSRPVWLLEATPKDRYYLYGKILIAIDRETYKVSNVVKYDWKGQPVGVFNRGISYGKAPDGYRFVNLTGGGQGAAIQYNGTTGPLVLTNVTCSNNSTTNARGGCAYVVTGGLTVTAGAAAALAAAVALADKDGNGDVADNPRVAALANALARRLPAEVLLDSVFRATGSTPEFPGLKPGTRAAQLLEHHRGPVGERRLQTAAHRPRRLRRAGTENLPHVRCPLRRMNGSILDPVPGRMKM